MTAPHLPLTLIGRIRTGARRLAAGSARRDTPDAHRFVMSTPPIPDPGPQRSAFRRFFAAMVGWLTGPGRSPRLRDRRRVPRLPAPPDVRAAVYLDATDPGTDVALGLIDVSQDGAGLRLRSPLRPGEETYLDLYPPGGVDLVLVRRRAAVVWCRPDTGTSFRAGVRFTSQLTAEDLRVLAY